MIHRHPRHRSFLLLLLLVGALCAPIPAAAGGEELGELPDPLDRGPYTAATVDPFKAGLATLHEPSSSGGGATGAASEITLQIRGSMYRPVDKETPSPLIVLVHGNHGSCDSGSAPACTIFKRNDAGYAYLGENLATWGYTVVSLDQDQMMSRQDGSKGKGMHQRRLLIAALLDALYTANETGLPDDENANLGTTLVGKLDMTRIGMMGHSRGGDAVANFLDYNRMRPEPGRRYPLRGVISLAPVDYERKAPYGTPFMTILPWCDGDVSNLQGARHYERGQYAEPNDPFPRIQSSQLGANHNWYNSVWFADGQDGNSGTDQACRDTQPNHSRLSGSAGPGAAENYVIDNSDKLNPLVNTRISGDPARMGDQEKIGLATMAAFFRRYVGGEGAFDPYMTGELSTTEDGLQIPASACPTSAGGMRMPCVERVSTSYFAPPGERLDAIRPETENPLGLSALGTALTGSGFSNPYLEGGGVPVPPTTPGGFDWCNPEPNHTEPSQLGVSGLPTAAKQCPLPATSALGGQSGVRESAPVNHSYGRQLALAWDDPVAATGEPATLATKVPAAFADVSGFEALAMGADVNFFDPRNPVRADEAVWNPALTTQDFTIALTDSEGVEGTVAAGDPRYGNALHQTPGTSTARVHIVLDQIRVPLADFAEQGVDLTAIEKLELRFGEAGMPETGSIQLADVRFQEAAEGTGVLIDSTAPDAGPATGPVTSGPDPAALLESYDRDEGSVALPDVVSLAGSNTWTVDDDEAECPNAQFASIQAAIDYAAPWDTIVVCSGIYLESSTPVHHNSNPVQPGSRNGLTITKPLRIKGAGAEEVTIRPAPSLGPSLAGTAPYLRDGGGNVVTISRQSLGSTDDNEMFVDISGVTIESPGIFAEAGVAFFNTSGRISNSVVGPLKRATSAGGLAATPHGWGVISTNTLLGVGPGTVTRQVTIDETLIGGYQSGGILFDSARGTDGHADNTVRYGIRTQGYVTDSIVEGSGPSSLIPQTGIRYHAGARGFVAGSLIAGNAFPTDQRKSVGLLLTDAETGDWDLSGSTIAGNGYGLFNADIANAAVREAAPALATGNWWGPGGPPIEGQSLLGFGIEGISGDDTTPADSVLVEPALSEDPGAPAGPGPVVDEAPSGSIVDPGDGTEVAIGEQIEPVVFTEDDFGVKSVSLTGGGKALGTISKAPYAFAWTPSEAEAGETVTLEATVVDSGGQATTASVEVEVSAPQVEPGETTPPEPTTATEPLAESPAPTSAFGIAALRRNPKAGTALLEVRLQGPGVLVLKGTGVRAVVRKAAAASTQTIAVRPTGAAKRTLHRIGRVTIDLELTFRGTSASPSTKTRSVVLVKRH